jgi:hypothetical protein
MKKKCGQVLRIEGCESEVERTTTARQRASEFGELARSEA